MKASGCWGAPIRTTALHPFPTGDVIKHYRAQARSTSPRGTLPTPLCNERVRNVSVLTLSVYCLLIPLA